MHLQAQHRRFVSPSTPSQSSMSPTRGKTTTGNNNNKHHRASSSSSSSGFSVPAGKRQHLTYGRASPVRAVSPDPSGLDDHSLDDEGLMTPPKGGNALDDSFEARLVNECDDAILRSMASLSGISACDSPSIGSGGKTRAARTPSTLVSTPPRGVGAASSTRVSPLVTPEPVEIDCGSTPPPTPAGFDGLFGGLPQEGRVAAAAAAEGEEDFGDIDASAPCFLGVRASVSLRSWSDLSPERSSSKDLRSSSKALWKDDDPSATKSAGGEPEGKAPVAAEAGPTTEREEEGRRAGLPDEGREEDEDGGDGGPDPSSLREIWTGDIGLALFSPLDRAAFEPLAAAAAAAEEKAKEKDGRPSSPSSWSNRSFSEDEKEEEEEKKEEYEYVEEEEVLPPLAILPEPSSSLKSNPRILTVPMMTAIRDLGLHPTVQLMTWHRAYSLSRDGDSFHTMLRMCEGYNHTVFAARTSRGDVLGGYADKPWSRKEGGMMGNGKAFYGSGRAFLFATDPANEDGDCGSGSGEGKEEYDPFGGGGGDRGSDEGDRRIASPASCGGTDEGTGGENSDDDDDDDNSGGSLHRDTLHVYKWTGSNTYSQIFDAEGEHMAMGGGGSFGIIVEDNFTRGSTGRCATFGNPPLTRDIGGCFDICEFEVYGLKSSLTGSFSMMF